MMKVLNSSFSLEKIPPNIKGSGQELEKTLIFSRAPQLFFLQTTQGIVGCM